MGFGGSAMVALFGEKLADAAPWHRRRAARSPHTSDRPIIEPPGKYGIHHELGQHTRIKCSRQHVARTHPKHERDRAKEQHDDHRRKHRAHADALTSCGQRAEDGATVTIAFDAFARIGFDRRRCVERLVGDRQRRRQDDLGWRAIAFVPGAQTAGSEAPRRESPAQSGPPSADWSDHGNAGADEHDGTTQCHGDARTDQRLYHLGVGTEARDQFAHAAAFEKAHSPTGSHAHTVSRAVRRACAPSKLMQ